MTLQKLNEMARRGTVTGTHPVHGKIVIKEATEGGIWFTGEKQSYHYDVHSLCDLVVDQKEADAVAEEKPEKKRKAKDSNNG